MFEAAFIGIRDSILARDHLLRTARLSDTFTIKGETVLLLVKNSLIVTPSAEAILSRDAIDGETCPNSTCEIKLGEKPDLLASQRTDNPPRRRKRRTILPTYRSSVTGVERLAAMLLFQGPCPNQCVFISVLMK